MHLWVRKLVDARKTLLPQQPLERDQSTGEVYLWWECHMCLTASRELLEGDVLVPDTGGDPQTLPIGQVK